MLALKDLIHRLAKGSAPSQVSEAEIKKPVEKEKKLRYVYLEQCDGDQVSLEAAEELYRDNDLVRVVKHGKEKCYMELMLDPDVEYYGDNKVFDRI